MKIKVINTDISKVKCDILAVGFFEGTGKLTGRAAEADKMLGGTISSLISGGEITGKLSSSTVIHSKTSHPVRRVLVVGLGKRADLDMDAIRMASCAVIRSAKKVKAKTVATTIHGSGDIDRFDACRALTEASVLDNYEFKDYKTDKDDEDSEGLEELVVVSDKAADVPGYKKSVFTGQVCADAANKAKDLVNMPSNMLTPKDFVKIARETCSQNRIKLKVLGVPEIKKLGMGALWGVAKGSIHEPAVLVMEYNGGGSGAKPFGLVGKGITFDSGGISIKPSKKMHEMKGDMAGAAAVLFSMEALARLGLKKNVVAVVPLTENMPDGGALKPGDVIKTINGKTVEIISTDAEGRLILADALGYANRLGVSKLMDFATLTGACTVALGDVASAILGNDDEYVESVIASADKSGERLWRLPLYKEYREYLKSSVADMKNCSDLGKASTSTAAIFLKEFVGDTPWVHIDIANTADLDRDVRFYKKGPTGAGVFTAINYLLYS